jgi:hypothetical protein
MPRAGQEPRGILLSLPLDYCTLLTILQTGGSGLFRRKEARGAFHPAAARRPTLAPAYPLPVAVATGEYESGKSLLLLTTDYPLEATLAYDNEQSLTIYEAMGDFTRVDLLTELGQKHPGGRTNLQFYEAWRDHMRAIKPGRYKVIGVDPIEQIESGIADWVRLNAGHCGHTAGQYQTMSGLFWGDVEDIWKRHIMELKARAEMVILTTHVRDVFLNGKPAAGKRERKGKETCPSLPPWRSSSCASRGRWRRAPGCSRAAWPTGASPTRRACGPCSTPGFPPSPGTWCGST